MKTLRFSLSLILLLVTPAMVDAALDDVDFNAQIKPLLAAKCFDCHGPDTQEKTTVQTSLNNKKPACGTNVLD